MGIQPVVCGRACDRHVCVSLHGHVCMRACVRRMRCVVLRCVHALRACVGACMRAWVQYRLQELSNDVIIMALLYIDLISRNRMGILIDVYPLDQNTYIFMHISSSGYLFILISLVRILIHPRSFSTWSSVTLWYVEFVPSTRFSVGRRNISILPRVIFTYLGRQLQAFTGIDKANQ